MNKTRKEFIYKSILTAAGLDVPMISTAVTGTDEEHTVTILRTISEPGIQNYRLGWIHEFN